MVFATLFWLLFIIPVALYAFYVYCWYRIMQKANYGALGLLSLLPPAVVVLIVILAFGPWQESKQDGIRYDKINPAD